MKASLFWVMALLGVLLMSGAALSNDATGLVNDKKAYSMCGENCIPKPKHYVCVDISPEKGRETFATCDWACKYTYLQSSYGKYTLNIKLYNY